MYHDDSDYLVECIKSRILIKLQQQPVFWQQPPLQHSFWQVSPWGQHCRDPLQVALHVARPQQLSWHHTSLVYCSALYCTALLYLAAHTLGVAAAVGLAAHLLAPAAGGRGRGVHYGAGCT